VFINIQHSTNNIYNHVGGAVVWNLQKSLPRKFTLALFGKLVDGTLFFRTKSVVPGSTKQIIATSYSAHCCIVPRVFSVIISFFQLFFCISWFWLVLEALNPVSHHHHHHP
jgi:hypothetical protein